MKPTPKVRARKAPSPAPTPPAPPDPASPSQTPKNIRPGLIFYDNDGFGLSVVLHVGAGEVLSLNANGDYYNRTLEQFAEYRAGEDRPEPGSMFDSFAESIALHLPRLVGPGTTIGDKAVARVEPDDDKTNPFWWCNPEIFNELIADAARFEYYYNPAVRLSFHRNIFGRHRGVMLRLGWRLESFHKMALQREELLQGLEPATGVVNFTKLERQRLRRVGSKKKR